MDAGAVSGIITKTDLMKSALVRQIPYPVGDVMEDVAAVSRNHSLNHVISVMRERNDKVLVTEDDGIPAGIITETNLAFYEDEPKMGVMEKDVTDKTTRKILRGAGSSRYGSHIRDRRGRDDKSRHHGLCRNTALRCPCTDGETPCQQPCCHGERHSYRDHKTR